MKGTRVPDSPTQGEPVWGTVRRSPGDYGKVYSGGPLGTYWLVCDPVGNCYRLGGGDNPIHTIEEHGDGSITVNPSIVAPEGRIPYHGLLQRGIWS